MKKKFKIALILISVVILAILLVWIIPLVMPAKKTGISAPDIALTYTNIAPVLSSSSLVQDLPEESTLLLKFYNFNSGNREWEKSFILRNIGVIEGTDESPDIVLTLDSKYLNGLTNNNFCSMIQQAKKNGDLGIETSLSSASLAWKFKGMYKYRACLGF